MSKNVKLLNDCLKFFIFFDKENPIAYYIYVTLKFKIFWACKYLGSGKFILRKKCIAWVRTKICDTLNILFTRSIGRICYVLNILRCHDFHALFGAVNVAYCIFLPLWHSETEMQIKIQKL